MKFSQYSKIQLNCEASLRLSCSKKTRLLNSKKQKNKEEVKTKQKIHTLKKFLGKQQQQNKLRNF